MLAANFRELHVLDLLRKQTFERRRSIREIVGVRCRSNSPNPLARHRSCSLDLGGSHMKLEMLPDLSANWTKHIAEVMQKRVSKTPAAISIINR